MGPGPRLPLTNWCVVLESFSYSRPLPFNPAPPPWGPHGQSDFLISQTRRFSPTCARIFQLIAYQPLPALASSHPIWCRPNSPGLVVFVLTDDGRSYSQPKPVVSRYMHWLKSNLAGHKVGISSRRTRAGATEPKQSSSTGPLRLIPGLPPPTRNLRLTNPREDPRPRTRNGPLLGSGRARATQSETDS